MAQAIVPTNPYYPQIDKNVDPKVTRHLQNLYTGTVNHDQAIVLLKSQLDALSTTVKTTTTAAAAPAASSSSSSSSTSSFTGLGSTNNQTGNTSYAVQQTDSGALIVLSDASPVAVSLNSVITSPFLCWIANLGAGLATLTPTSGTVNGSATFPLPQNYTALVVFSGGLWWATALPVVPQNTPAVAHEWINAYNSATGIFTQTRPALSDLTGIPLSGVSGSLGGSPMTAGQTITIAVTVTGAAVGMVATTSPETYPGDGFNWDSYVSAANTVTVRLTAVLAATPAASLFDVRVIQ